MEKTSSARTSAQDISTWLARETGHTPEADEGYEEGAEGKGYNAEEGMGLPNPKHEKLRRFFDGLHVQKSLDEKRRAESLTALDEADQMNQALKKAVPAPGNPPTNPTSPGGF